jgi:hypothetical protein
MLKTPQRPRTEDKSVDANLAEWSPTSQKNTMLALAECLQQLAPKLSKEIDTVLQRFGGSDIDAAFDNAAHLIDHLRFNAATSCKSDRAIEIIQVIDTVQENAGTAVEFATKLIRNDLRRDSPGLTKAAFEYLLSDVISGILELSSISENLKKESKPPASIEEIIKELELSGKSNLVQGDPSASFSKPSDVRENQSAFGPSGEKTVVANVMQASSRCEPERILLVDTAKFVGKDGQIYQLARSSESKIPSLDSSKGSDLVLSYDIHEGSSFIGSIANYKIAGFHGTEKGAARLESDLLAGAQISGLDLNSNKIQVSYNYDPSSNIDQTNLASEILSISGVRTAFSRLSAKAIETFSKSTSPKRIHSLCAAFFANDYVYSKDPELHKLIKLIPQNLRFSFLAGLRIGKCSSMSYELQNFLAIAGVPAIVESGPAYDPDLKAFCDPGHARVRCIGEPSVVIDPTLWVRDSYNVITPGKELKTQVLAQLVAADENKAFEIGEQLRGKLLATNINSGRQGAADQNNGGHQLKDDFNRQSAGDLGLELVDPLEAIKAWSELIELDLDGRSFYLRDDWCQSEALVNLLKRDQDAIVAGNPAVFTDWLIACLQHPDPKLAKIVNRAFFNSGVFQSPLKLDELEAFERGRSIAISVLKVLAATGPDDYVAFIVSHGYPYFVHFLMQAYSTSPTFSDGKLIMDLSQDIKDIYTQAGIRSLNALSCLDSPAFMRLLIEMASGFLSGDCAKLITDVVTEKLKSSSDIAPRFFSGYKDDSGLPCIEKLTSGVRSFSQACPPFIKSQSIKSLSLCVDFHLALKKSIEEISRDILDVDNLWVANLGKLSLTSAKSLLANGLVIDEGRKNRYISPEEVDKLLQSDSFQDGIRSHTFKLLRYYLEDILTLESNLPDLNRQELRDLAREAIALVSSIGALKLDYPSELVKLREWIMGRRDGWSHWHEIAWLYFNIDTLIEHDILLESDVAELCQQVDESEVAWEIWNRLHILKSEIPGGSLSAIQIFLSGSGYGVKLKPLWHLMLLSIQDQAASLPPGWSNFADAVVELYVPDSIKTVWRVVSDKDPELLTSFTGVKTEQDLTKPLWKAAVIMADGALDKIIHHSFLMTADDGDYDPEAPHSRKALCEALRIYIPDLKEPAHVEAYAAVITQVLIGDFKPLQTKGNLDFFLERVMWTRLQEELKPHPGSIRRHLWNHFKGADIEDYPALNKGPSKISPDLWRNALQGSSTKPTGKVMRALSGVSDPYDVRNLTQYAPGDSIRMIDWKVSGRSEQIYVKQPERVLPVNTDQVTVCIDRSDMGTTGENIAINYEFIDKLFVFIRSMIADKKSLSIAFFSYGVPDSIISAAEVRELFYDADGSRARDLFIGNASHSSDTLISAIVSRNCPTIAPVAEAEVLKMANTSVLLMLTNKSGTRTAPKTPIWVDRFSSQLQSSGKAALIDI